MIQQTPRSRLKADRREQLLRLAARLFAERGFHAVSIEELGASAGVTGPAMYRHFASKQDVLANLLVGVSRRLLDGGRSVVAVASGDEEALEGLVAFHTDFALTDSDLIRVQDRDLTNLTAADARLVRRLQRAYLEIWVAVLSRLDPDLAPPVARIQVHAVFGLLNSTPHSLGQRDLSTSRVLLERMAVTCLRPGDVARATGGGGADLPGVDLPRVDGAGVGVAGGRCGGVGVAVITEAS